MYKPKKNYNKKSNYRNDRSNRNRNSIKKYGVKISNLPKDITIRELNDLIQPWGRIGNINLGKSSNITAYIDFFDLDEAEYFIKALDKTPFDNLIIDVELNKK